jgi:hypothetical protein
VSECILSYLDLVRDFFHQNINENTLAECCVEILSMIVKPGQSNSLVFAYFCALTPTLSYCWAGGGSLKGNSVYIYSRVQNTTLWSEQQQLQPGKLKSGINNFGFSLALTTDLLAVGANNGAFLESICIDLECLTGPLHSPILPFSYTGIYFVIA